MKDITLIITFLLVNINCDYSNHCKDIDLMLFGNGTNSIISNWHIGMSESQFIDNWNSLAVKNHISTDEKEFRGLNICIGDIYSIPTHITRVSHEDAIVTFQFTFDVTGMRKGQDPYLIYEEIANYMNTKLGKYNSRDSFNELYWKTQSGSYYLSTAGYLFTLRYTK